MIQNKNTNQNEKLLQIMHSFGAWVLTMATLVCATKADRQPRVTLSNIAPVYAQVDPVNDWARKNSENETVHMQTRLDVGLRYNVVAGKK